MGRWFLEPPTPGRSCETRLFKSDCNELMMLGRVSKEGPSLDVVVVVVGGGGGGVVVVVVVVVGGGVSVSVSVSVSVVVVVFC